MWRREDGLLRVLLVHPGGPFWKNKDAGAWSIPKGEYLEGEDPLAAARRELVEELGKAAEPLASSLDSAFQSLGAIKQKGGKIVVAYALEGTIDATHVTSNTFEMEWPLKSGRLQPFPEIDRAGWFSLDEAREKILPAQLELLSRLENLVH